MDRRCRLCRLTVLTLALAGLALLLGACGSGGSGGGQSQTASRTYTNDQYGLSMTYDDRFAEGQVLTPISGSTAVLEVTFPDPNGPSYDNKHAADQMLITVNELGGEITPAELRKTVKKVLAGAADTIATFPDGKMVQPPKEITINGIPGYSMQFSYSRNGTALTEAFSALLKGHYQYTLTGTAATQDWEALKGKFEAAFQTFTVK